LYLTIRIQYSYGPMAWLYCKRLLLCKTVKLIWVYNPVNGVSNPKYKLLCFLTNFCEEKKALAFNRDRFCHLALFLRLILLSSIVPRKKSFVRYPPVSRPLSNMKCSAPKTKSLPFQNIQMSSLYSRDFTLKIEITMGRGGLAQKS
jgi:hypothetical protein